MPPLADVVVLVVVVWLVVVVARLEEVVGLVVSSLLQAAGKRPTPVMAAAIKRNWKRLLIRFSPSTCRLACLRRIVSAKGKIRIATCDPH